MTSIRLVLCVALVGLPAMTSYAQTDLDAARASVEAWEVHDESRPRPPAVAGGAAVTTPPPSDAVVLFDGSGLDGWSHVDGGAAGWRTEEGAMVVEPGTGNIATDRGFGDVQLHLEWAAPAEVSGEGQGRGNSGVFLMGRYEIQVLDSYQNPTYADGQAASIYGQYPPLVNAMRPPGEWQSYDIIFHRPRYDEEGELLAPARATVLHNGVLVQDDVVLTGPTGHYSRPAYEAHGAALPLVLQDHGNPVRFRNIWARPLEASAETSNP